MTRILYAIIIFTGFFLPRALAETYTLDLESSILIAKQKNFNIRILQKNLEQAQFNLNAATSSFKTHIDLDLMVPNYTETIRQFEDSTGLTFYPIEQLQYSAELIINQPLPTDGRFFLSSGILNTDDFDKDEKLFRIDTRLGLSQPIEAFYAYNQIKSEFENAKLGYELSLKQLQRQELNVIYEVSNAFYDVVEAQERMNIAQLTLQRQKNAHEIAQNKFRAGLIREVEALQMEVDLGQAQNNYDISIVQFNSSMTDFKMALGISLKDNVEIENDLSYKLITVDADQAVERGLQNRLEIREHEIQIERQRIEIKRRKSNGTINGDINAYYDFIGVSQNNLPIPIADALDDTWEVLRNRPGNFGVNLQLRIPILDWGENRSRVKAAQSSLEQQYIELEEEKLNIERQIINLVSQTNSSLQRLQLLEKNISVAEKSFEISNQRFSNGDITSQELALERERLNDAYISRLNSYISYKLNLVDLMRRTFYDYEKGMAIVQ